jgi:hypothetical protein
MAVDRRDPENRVRVDKERRVATRRYHPRPGGRRADDPPAEWINISDYAKRYGVARGTVYDWLHEGLLWTYEVGTITRVRNLPPDDHPAARAAYFASKDVNACPPSFTPEN